MKNKVKLILFCMFSSVSSLGYAEKQTVLMSAKTQENATVSLKSLDFKSFFMHFYQQKIRYIHMNQQLENAVGILSDDGKLQYAVFNPVQTFKSVKGEARFVVWIEFYDQENGEINTGHPSRPHVALYLFEQGQDGQYQLLSRTRPQLDVAGSWGESHLTAEDFQNVQRVGKNQMGLTYSGGYTSTGSHTEFTNLIVFNERGWIEHYPFGISESNIWAHEASDPEFGEYSKKYSLMKNMASDNLYPIQIEYFQQGKMDWREFPENGSKERLFFHDGKNCYLHHNGQCDVSFDED